ncbi:DUF882 domain-containing protein [Terriglobus albidus]|uniref:Murein endopeptidase K n=1 Tax=Terriglobus albidus TaxID=1592106 RepID=A0A5B9EJ79_9BACT|nr:DUF882 domain-containing protein [Terriglobus albidus]QEE30176.1 DUF882 domain-containing protein [Terriglobus albidus]
MQFRRLACGAVFSALLLMLFGSRTAAHANDLPTGINPVPSRPLEQYRLRLHHLHTGEDIDVVYKIGNEYVPSGIAKLNGFLRDHRTGDIAHYDPKEFDVLHTLLARLGRPNNVIDIVCGYRTPWSNNFLRGRNANTGVAKNSQHVLAKAIDIRVPGITTARLRQAALSLHAGGVGYYPVSQFVHVDVGPVRQWTYGTAHND